MVEQSQGRPKLIGKRSMVTLDVSTQSTGPGLRAESSAPLGYLRSNFLLDDTLRDDLIRAMTLLRDWGIVEDEQALRLKYPAVTVAYLVAEGIFW